MDEGTKIFPSNNAKKILEHAPALCQLVMAFVLFCLFICLDPRHSLHYVTCLILSGLIMQASMIHSAELKIGDINRKKNILSR